VSRGAAGRLLVVLGGALLVAGALWPELQVAVRNLLDRAGELPPPDRSHWSVLHENLDMVVEPDRSSPDYFNVWYAVQSAGLAWFVFAGGVIALAAFFARSRLVASVCALFHGATLFGLAAGVSFVYFAMPPPEPGKSSLVTLGPALLLWSLGVGEALLAWRAMVHDGLGGGFEGGLRRLAAVDTANVLPLAFLFIAHACLYALLRGHPNWPAGGYLVGAIGGALALLGMQRRLVPRR